MMVTPATNTTRPTVNRKLFIKVRQRSNLLAESRDLSRIASAPELI